MSNASASPSPVKETPATLQDLMTVNIALTELLTQEAAYMDAMELTKVAAVQDRKLKLTSLLERYMHYIHKHPEVLAGVTEEEKKKLREVSQQFQIAMKRNYGTLMVARAVNKTVVKCVTQLVTRKEQNPIYNANGFVKTGYRPLPVSITLNETV